MTWYYAVAGRQFGPVSTDGLISKKIGRQIASTDLVWKDGMAEWLPFREVPELAGGGLQPQQTTKRHITREVALDFVSHPKDSEEGLCDGDLIWGTSIDHSAARVFVEYEGVLRLKGLIEIDDLAAELLSCYFGPSLCLDGLENVTDLGLEKLSHSLAAHLQLSGKVLKSQSRAEYFSQNYEGTLVLRCEGIKISNDVIEGLWRFRGEALALDGFTLIDAESLTYLAGLKVENLFIPGEIFEGEDHQLDLDLADSFLNDFHGNVRLTGEGYEEDEEDEEDEDYEDYEDYEDDRSSIGLIKIDEGAPSDEFIVEVNFEYCDVEYQGYMIVDRETISVLNRELDSGREVYTPNMPGSWCEEFEISELKGAFTIHSEKATDVEAMRSLFGERIGNVQLITMITDMVADELAEESDDDDD